MKAKLFFMLALLCGSTVNAGIVNTFTGNTGRNMFLDLPNAISATGAIPNLGNVGTSETIGDVTFVSGGNISVGPDNRTLINPGNDIVISGLSNLNVTFAMPVLGFGFDIVDTNDPSSLACNATCLDSEFEISLFDFEGGMQIGNTITFNPAFSDQLDVLDFFGVQTDMFFSYVEIMETVGGSENEIFGEFYSSVPIPAPLVLFGSALLLLLPFRKKVQA